METKTQRKQETQKDTALQALQNHIVIHRVFNLSKKVVWLALTDPEYFKKWWGPKGFTCPVSKMEARVGAKLPSLTS